MPFKVVKRGGKKPYKIVRKDTGKTVGASKTKRKARIAASIRQRKAHGRRKRR